MSPCTRSWTKGVCTPSDNIIHMSYRLRFAPYQLQYHLINRLVGDRRNSTHKVGHADSNHGINKSTSCQPHSDCPDKCAGARDFRCIPPKLEDRGLIKVKEGRSHNSKEDHPVDSFHAPRFQRQTHPPAAIVPKL